MEFKEFRRICLQGFLGSGEKSRGIEIRANQYLINSGWIQFRFVQLKKKDTPEALEFYKALEQSNTEHEFLDKLRMVKDAW